MLTKHTAPDPLGSPLPLAAAPMAGGPTTPRLAAAVAEAGAFAFLAGGYKAPEALAAEIAQVRRHGAAFGVNLFVPNTSPISEAEFRRYARDLQDEADHYGLDLSQAPLLEDDDRWQHKLDLLLADPVPVVSVTFGLPRPAEVAALRRAGSQFLATVTTVEEARAAALPEPD
jgi:nitronate monooxygenase